MDIDQMNEMTEYSNSYIYLSPNDPDQESLNIPKEFPNEIKLKLTVRSYQGNNTSTDPAVNAVEEYAVYVRDEKHPEKTDIAYDVDEWVQNHKDQIESFFMVDIWNFTYGDKDGDWVSVDDVRKRDTEITQSYDDEQADSYASRNMDDFESGHLTEQINRMRQIIGQ